MSEEFSDYSVSYWHRGAEWVTTVKANSFEDAQERLYVIGRGKIDGVIMASYPAYPGMGLFLTLVCSVRNFFFRASR